MDRNWKHVNVHCAMGQIDCGELGLCVHLIWNLSAERLHRGTGFCIDREGVVLLKMQRTFPACWPGPCLTRRFHNTNQNWKLSAFT